MYGETVKKMVEIIDGWWHIPDEDGNNATPDPDPTTATPTPATATPDPDPTTATAKPASGKSNLARTGAGLGIAVIAGGLLAFGGILVARRRRTS